MKHLLLAAAWASPAIADSFVELDRRVSDAAFHLAVACAAPPGEGCTEPLAAWPAPQRRELTVSLDAERAARPDPRHGAVGQALDAAIRQINRLGADIRLVRVADGSPAAIMLWDSDILEGQPIVLPEAGMDGAHLMEGARVEILWDADRWITEATIVIAGDLSPSDFRSVILEELVQSLGLLTDITGSAYADTSIFSETSNAVTRLSGQDAAVIRLHYPKE